MPAVDKFEDHTEGLNSPASDYGAITADDNTDLDNLTRAIYVGGDGDLVVHDPEGNPVTFASLAAGTLLPIRAARVLATGTTATGLVGIY